MHYKSYGTESFDASETIVTVGILTYHPTHEKPQEFKIKNFRTVIGRAKTANIRISDQTVSKFHAVIYKLQRRYYLKDCGSTNETYINSNKVEAIEHLTPEGEPVPADDLRHPGIHVRTRQSSHAQRIFKMEEGVQLNTENIDFPPSEQITDAETLRQDYERLRVAYLFNRTGSDMDVDNMISRCLDVLFQLFPTAESAVVLLAEEKQKEMKLAASRLRERDGEDKEGEFVFSSKLVEYVRRQKQAILSRDCQSDDRWTLSHSIVQMDTRSTLAVPLIGGGEVVGVLVLDSSQQDAFSKKDLSLLTSVAAPIGKVVVNQRLLNRVLKEEKEHESLSRFLPQRLLQRILRPGDQPSPSSSLPFFNASTSSSLATLNRTMSSAQLMQRDCVEVQHGTIFFAEPKGVSRIYRHQTHSEQFTFLNEYFDKMVSCVFRHDGVLDKYIDDMMMVTWGGTLLEEHRTLSAQEIASRAVIAALECRQAIWKWNKERKEKYDRAFAQYKKSIAAIRSSSPLSVAEDQLAYPPFFNFELGIGINTGKAIAGFLGATQRLEYTMIGDAVNLASRLCSVAEPLQILISEETNALVANMKDVLTIEVSPKSLKGFKDKVRVFEVEYGCHVKRQNVRSPSSDVALTKQKRLSSSSRASSPLHAQIPTQELIAQNPADIRPASPLSTSSARSSSISLSPSPSITQQFSVNSSASTSSSSSSIPSSATASSSLSSKQSTHSQKSKTSQIHSEQLHKVNRSDGKLLNLQYPPPVQTPRSAASTLSVLSDTQFSNTPNATSPVTPSSRSALTSRTSSGNSLSPAPSLSSGFAQASAKIKDTPSDCTESIKDTSSTETSSTGSTAVDEHAQSASATAAPIQRRADLHHHKQPMAFPSTSPSFPSGLNSIVPLTSSGSSAAVTTSDRKITSSSSSPSQTRRPSIMRKTCPPSDSLTSPSSLTVKNDETIVIPIQSSTLDDATSKKTRSTHQKKNPSSISSVSPMQGTSPVENSSHLHKETPLKESRITNMTVESRHSKSLFPASLAAPVLFDSQFKKKRSNENENEEQINFVSSTKDENEKDSSVPSVPRQVDNVHHRLSLQPSSSLNSHRGTKLDLSRFAPIRIPKFKQTQKNVSDPHKNA
ncbi:putative adenylate cyclase [Monocercomonoides exilis]|uniref:putative adenylate cyclase n=1 Tax=Monocercomonoides exilis TaxID=2049356 RepID=UPI00355990AF|nr:putative adenylate cyclase [Monocercomonoides exilis]|eukprot:MONOS_10444.1-p1 / transcript=MONOS_10444.1 / gene=MONOS_10444 / organism=Monocercomonoides_exilis_PA203 / gene_product=adenylate cyclase / transcript_product=adenylate cyclase / location=Mono_scaffold00475:39729-43299(+) / protein_length=1122 / sequence_SO=supercontig / SO=protein_coding / is_pseudo=false